MKGYKVTDCDGFSVGRKLRKHPPEAGIIYYPAGTEIKPLPGMGPLAVFEKVEDAVRFRDHFECYKFRAFEIEFKRSFLHYLFDGGKKLYKSSSINGTVYADSLK